MIQAIYKDENIQGGLTRWTEAPKDTAINSHTYCENEGISAHKAPNSILYTNVNLNLLNNKVVEVHPDCPPTVVEYIQHRVEWSMPVLNWLFPYDPCWKYLGKSNDGYAKHNPRRFKNLPEEAMTCSTVLSRFIYRWLYSPQGISRSYDVDHKCGRGDKGCINPRHLQLLTPELNKALGNRDEFKTI